MITTTTSTVNLRRFSGVLGGLVSLALVTACPPPSGETATDSEGSTSSTSSTGGSNQTATVTITTTASATDSTSDPTATDPTTGPTSATTGDPVCAPSDEFSCLGGFDCDDCGALGSRFDSDGCLRPSCGDDGECGEDEICYGANWGLCTSSQYNCADADGTCSCDMTDDCGGNYCVPTSALPGSASPAEGLRIVRDCGPDDGPALALEVGLADPSPDPDQACKSGLSESWLRLSLWDQQPPLAPGTYPVSQGMNSAGDGWGGGWLTVESWEGDAVSGSYAAILGDSLYEGSFSAAASCTDDVICG